MAETTVSDLHLDMPEAPLHLDFRNLKKGYEDLDWLMAATAALRRIFLLLSLLWLVIVVSVPALKRIKVLGLPLWKWTVAAALVACGYHVISWLSQRTVKKLSQKMIKDKYDVVYYADGLRRSVNIVIFCVFILLAWELYFRSSQHGLRRYGFSEKALDIGTWTAVSLLVDAFLVLAKNAVILSWQSHAIYHHFTNNISHAGRQLYFLGLVSGTNFDIFSPREEGEDKGAGEVTNKSVAEENNGKQEDDNEKENKVKAAGECSGKEDDTKENEEEKKINEKMQGKKEMMDKEEQEKEKRKKKEQEKKKMDKEKQDKEKVEEANRFMSTNSKLSYASTYHKKNMANYFILAARLYSRKDDSVPEEIRKQWLRFKQQDGSENSCMITKESVKKNLQDLKTTINDAEINHLFNELRVANNLKYNQDSASTDKDEIPYDTFEEWMMKAFKNCLSLGYTLSDAKDVSKYLNNIFEVFVKIVVILCWLLLTGIASAKALITIATPFLAATFIFGDMLKAVFEGMIFSFVTHPFIVGDLCIIDDTQLEVKQMDILKTTFHKIDSKEKVLYPNKILAGKTISNLERHLECRDCIELSLNESVDVNSLEKKIERFFESNKGKFKEGFVMTKEIGETITIAIHFEHVMSIQDDMYAQFFKKKKVQRSELLKEVLRIKKEVLQQNETA